MSEKAGQAADRVQARGGHTPQFTLPQCGKTFPCKSARACGSYSDRINYYVGDKYYALAFN